MDQEPLAIIGNIKFYIIKNCNEKCTNCKSTDNGSGMLFIQCNSSSTDVYYEEYLCSICFMAITAELLAVWTWT